MSRELWLLRHGKSNRNVIMADFDRPLKKRGKRAAQRIGKWLQQQRLIPDWILSSPAKRALKTAQIVLKAIDAPNLEIEQDDRLYQEGFERLKTVLAECPLEANRVLLVGHNPELEDLLVNLVGVANLPDTEKLLPTAALARLALPNDWTHLNAGCARLLSITYAKSLPEEGI